MEQNIKIKAVKGFKWTATSQVLNQLVVLGFNIAMMHFLTPYDYGLFAVPFIIYSLLRLIVDLGFTEAYIRARDENLYPSFFWFVLFFGFILSLLFYLTSPLVSKWTGNKESCIISMWLALALFLGSLFVPIDAKIRKQLDFRSAFIIEISSNLFSGFLGLWLVIFKYEWLALPLKTLVYCCSLSLCSIAVKSSIPSFTFKFKMLFGKFNFAFPNISEQILNFFQKNADTLLIDKVLGNIQLGLYDRANKLLLLPIQQISSSFSKVMYPSFVSFQDDKEKIATSYIKVCGLIAMITFPVMLLIFCIADLLVITLFGEQWTEIIPLLKILSLAGGFQSISNLSPQIFYLTNKNWLLLRYSLISKFVYILLLFISVFIFQDILFTTTVVAITTVLLTMVGWYLIAKVLEIQWSGFIKVVAPQIFIALIMALIVYFLKSVLTNHVEGLFLIMFLSLTSIVIVYTILILSKNKSYIEMRSLLKNLN